jgi:acyl-CoA thioesterase FadM
MVNQGNRLIVEGETYHVCTGMNDKPRRLPEELVSKLSPFLLPEDQTA